MGITHANGRTRRWSSGRMRAALIATAVLLIGGSVTTAAAQAPATRSAADADTLRILVTNDDGVRAPGIAVLVNILQTLPNVEVTVIAPATNQSGTGVNFSSGNVTVAPATTVGGDAATAVSGTPSDSVLYAVLSALPQRPQLVVSGVNQGQNLGTLTDISGTVGAGRTANRLGIPALAVSAGFGAKPNYIGAALTARAFIDLFHASYTSGEAAPQTGNINAPTCPTGNTRGIIAVPLGQPSRVTGYTLQSGTTGNGVFAPTIANQNPVATANCMSTLTDPKDDIEAFNNGFITLTALNPDLGDR